MPCLQSTYSCKYVIKRVNIPLFSKIRVSNLVDNLLLNVPISINEVMLFLASLQIIMGLTSYKTSTLLILKSPPVGEIFSA